MKVLVLIAAAALYGVKLTSGTNYDEFLIDGDSGFTLSQVSESDLDLKDDGNFRTFEIKDDLFYMDGKEMRLIAGSVHYFRIVPELWLDRLQRMKAMGHNAVTVYVAWNFHEMKRGVFDFESQDRDLVQFLKLAQGLGMFVVLRPGPYICAEWDFGGFPAWILENGTIPLRTYSEPYISYVDAFFEKLLPMIRPLLYVESGGPVIMVQIENEYGSFGNVKKNTADADYIRHLIDLTRKHLGQDIILFTTDGPGAETAGSLAGEDVITFVDGCHEPKKNHLDQQKMNPQGMSPFFCTETYTGWLSHWSEPKLTTRATADVVNLVNDILDQVDGKASVSLYMSHGGTNFGFWSGANRADPGAIYQPHVTTYDYNSPIAEAGENGVGTDNLDKFIGFRDLFMKVQNTTALPIPPLPPRLQKKIKVPFTHSVPLFHPSHIELFTSSSKHQLADPVAAETFGCYYGFVTYSGKLKAATDAGSLLIDRFQDRAYIYAAGKQIGIIYRNDQIKAVNFPPLKVGDEIIIMVEHMGRINFDPKGLKDTRFGLFESPILNNNTLPLENGWTARCHDFSHPHKIMDAIEWQSIENDELKDHRLPALFMADLSSVLSETAGKDLFVRPVDEMDQDSTAKSGKGVIWYNGFNLGRYWTGQPPQRSLYAPGPKTKSRGKPHRDTIVVLEIESAAEYIWLEPSPQNLL